MAKMYYTEDAERKYLEGKKVAVIGYGSQGHAHALNLKESGFDVRVGLYEGSKSKERAAAAGLKVMNTDEAVKEADLVMVLVKMCIRDSRLPSQCRDCQALLLHYKNCCERQ